MRDEQEQPKQQPRKVTQRLVISRWLIQQAGKWVDSDKVNLNDHVPLECYSQPVQTVRQVER